MPLRPFKLPADLPVIIDLIPPTFQYPENEEWNVQADEMEGMVDTFKGVRRIWPLLRLIKLISPPMRDVLRGYIWEEDGKPVGLTNIMRQGATDRWYIGNVAVLPDYRRRGIARKLVEACVQYAREHGAKGITLDVVSGNLPAYTLYEQLGFDHYSSQSELMYEADGQVGEMPMPEGYEIRLMPMFDWKPRYELSKRVIPEAVQKYTPVEEGRFRQPLVVRWLMPIFWRATGTRPAAFGVFRAADQQLVATALITVRTRAGGTCNVSFILDPAHAVVAPALVRHALREIQQASPGRRIESAIPDYYGEVIAAALEAGFTRRWDHCTMGMLVE